MQPGEPGQPRVGTRPRRARGRLIREGATGEAREEIFRRLFERIDNTAARASGVPDSEIDAAIDEAADFVRHHRE